MFSRILIIVLVVVVIKIFGRVLRVTLFGL